MKRASKTSWTMVPLVLGLLAPIINLSVTFAYAELPPEFDRNDRLLQLGLLDVTEAPYSADPTGEADSTDAIQRAVNDARDHGLVCFFPEGTFLVCDTISCEQQVSKLDRPRHVDGGTQHYWPVYRPIVLMGSTKGKRPVLKLTDDAQGFDDPARPKNVIRIWAQTWFDAPGKEEPVWGKEQANISFNHIFRGIDIDIRGHAGAMGIRHSGSQGSTMQDVTIYADGAYAGLNCCPGQGGGTHHVEVIGGQYGIVVEPDSRFPLLNACVFRGQTKAAIRYARGGSQVPTLLVGCRLEPLGGGRYRPTRGEPGRSPELDAFTLETVDDFDAAPGLSFLTLRGRVEWRSGRGTWMLTRAAFRISGHGGGRFYGVMAMGRPLILSGIRQPTSFYALNVERVTVNPQSEITDSSHIRAYYFKVEAGTIQRPNAGDGNTPCRISDSTDVRIYCMYGNVRKLGDRPMLEVVDSDRILVSHLKAFQPGSFPHVTETTGSERNVIPSSKTCTLLVREEEGDLDAK